MGKTAMQKLELLNAGDTTSGAKVWRGGKAQFALNGAFDGAQVKLQQIGPDGSNYLDMTTSQGSDYVTTVDLPLCQVRASVGSSGTSTSLYCTLVGIPD